MAKILWIIHNYPPHQNAGAEWMAKEINDYLISKKHEIQVVATMAPQDYTVSSVQVIAGTHIPKLLDKLLSWCDCIITHLDEEENATKLAEKVAKPCIHILHHSFEIPILRRELKDNYLVYNSQWVKEDRKYPHPGIVVRPPVNPERFKDIKYDPDGYITMVNCNRDKGALIFQNIAKAWPHRQFLAVKGAHGPQMPLRARNLVQWECQEDIRKVFEKTAILLVPSVYESYGRIGIEAMACGIPVIATDTPGLRESLGGYGMHVSREYIPSWLKAIALTTQIEDHSGVKKRPAELWEQSKRELNELHKLIKKITNVKN